MDVCISFLGIRKLFVYMYYLMFIYLGLCEVVVRRFRLGDDVFSDVRLKFFWVVGFYIFFFLGCEFYVLGDGIV